MIAAAAENLDSKWTGKHSEHGWQSSKLASRQQNSKLASCCTSEENCIDLQQKKRRIRSLQAVLAETSANHLKLQQQKLQQSHCKAQLHERSEKQLCCDSPTTTNHSSERTCKVILNRNIQFKAYHAAYFKQQLSNDVECSQTRDLVPKGLELKRLG